MYTQSEEIIKPRFERGVVAWFRRWFCCGYIRERRVMKIYLEVCQLDDKEIWNSEI
mgnify:CR=1 FL=1